MIITHVISTLNEKITSQFGMRSHPVTGALVQHNGVDFIDGNGLQRTSEVGILAFADGKVVFAGKSKEIGNYVDIAHDGKLLTRYFHMKRLVVTSGQQVIKGQVVGIMGTTGDSTGIHLHFGIKENSTSYANGYYVDPMPYLLGIKAIKLTTKSTAPFLPTVSSIKVPIVKTYTVKKNDSWWSIAQSKLGRGNRFEELAKFNGKTSKSVLLTGGIIKLPLK